MPPAAACTDTRKAGAPAAIPRERESHASPPHSCEREAAIAAPQSSFHACSPHLPLDFIPKLRYSTSVGTRT